MNWEGTYKREKERLTQRIDELDKWCESHGVDLQCKDEKVRLEEQLKFTMREEMLKWFQRSKEKEIYGRRQ